MRPRGHEWFDGFVTVMVTVSFGYICWTVFIPFLQEVLF